MAASGLVQLRPRGGTRLRTSADRPRSLRARSIVAALAQTSSGLGWTGRATRSAARIATLASCRRAAGVSTRIRSASRLQAVELDAEAPAADHREAQLGGARLGAVLAPAHPGGQAALRVDVDQRRRGGRRRAQGGGELDHERRLAGPALLLRHGDDRRRPSRSVAPPAVDDVQQRPARVEAARGSRPRSRRRSPAGCSSRRAG